MIDEKILERAKKLRAMAARGTLYEAEIAAAKLSELMFEHNLTEGMLEEREEEEFIRQVYRHKRKGGVQWRRLLYQGLARANFCRTAAIKGTDKQHIFGSPANVAFVNWLFEFLAPEIERLAELSWQQQLSEYERLHTPQVWRENAAFYKRSFKHGATAGILKRLRTERARMVHRDAATTALVDAHDARLSQFMADGGIKIRSDSRSPRLARDAYEEGQSAAQSLTLNRPIRSAPQGPLALKG